MAKLLNLLKLRSFSTAADSAVEVSVVSDTQPRLRVDAGGKHTWGAGGSSAGDTTLYRSAADTLKTDDAFIAAGGLTVKTTEIDTASATSGQVLAYNGTKFAPTSPTSGGATVSDSPPSSPSSGQIWFESDTGATFVYYDSTWIEVGSNNRSNAFTTCTSTTRPTSPYEGQAIYETDTDEVSVWNGSSWMRTVFVSDDENLSTTGSISAASASITGTTATGTINASTYQKSGVGVGVLRSGSIVISSPSASPTFYVLNLPSGCNVFNLVSVVPTTGVNNTLTVYEMRLGDWSGVQTTTQVGIYCALGNGVHTDPYYLNVYWIA